MCAAEADDSKKWPQYMAAFSAATAVFITGIHFAWPSPSVPMLMSDDYPFNITSDEASYIIGIGPVGDVVGSLLCSYLMDAIGRKSTLLLIALPQVVSFAMITLAHVSPYLIYFARFIGGIAEGFCFVAIPTYIGEVAEPRIRGILGSFLTCFFTVGMLTVNVVEMFLSFEITAAVCIILPIVYSVVLWQMPESPYYAVMKDRPEVAERSLVFLRRKRNVQKELLQIKSDVQRQLSEPGRWLDLVKIESNRKACIAMAGMRIAQQFGGLSCFNVYCQVLFGEATDSLTPQLSSVLFTTIQIVMTWISAMIVDKTGRKPLMITGCGSGGLTLIVLGVFFTLGEFTTLDLSGFQWIPFVCMMVYITVFGLGMGSTVNLLLGELFSTSIKGKALCLMNVVFSIFMVVSMKYFQLVKDAVGLYVPFYTFGMCALSGALFCFFYVPETKGKTLEDIQQEFKRGAK